MDRKGLVPEMIYDPQELEEGHRGRDKGAYHFFSNCPNVIINPSDNYCTHQMPGAVAGTRVSEMN